MPGPVVPLGYKILAGAGAATLAQLGNVMYGQVKNDPLLKKKKDETDGNKGRSAMTSVEKPNTR
tara:strand:- start:1856 stop:2047 length:192 start_codon:yes stop_codon:yes gene_type:complete